MTNHTSAKCKWTAVAITAPLYVFLLLLQVGCHQSVETTAVEDRRLTIRLAAIVNVTDQTLVQQWAETDPQAAIRSYTGV